MEFKQNSSLTQLQIMKNASTGRISSVTENKSTFGGRIQGFDASFSKFFLINTSFPLNYNHTKVKISQSNQM